MLMSSHVSISPHAQKHTPPNTCTEYFAAPAAAMLEWPKNMSRLKSANTNPSECAKTLRANLTKLDSALYLAEDLEEVVGSYSELMIDLLYLTPRPTKSWLQQGCVKAFDCSSGQAESFSGRLLAGFQLCRSKVSNSTTGNRLSPGVRAVVAVMKKLVSPELAQGLLAKQNSLERKQAPERSQAPVEETAPESLAPSKRLSPKPSPKLPVVTTSAGSSPNSFRKAAREKVFAELGVEDTGSGPEGTPLPEMMDLCSSEEDDDGSAAGASSSTRPSVQYFDNGLRAFVRIKGDQKTLATMSKGKGAFLMACFPGEEAFATEIPNVLLDLPEVMKRPSSKPMVCKRPAGSSRKKRRVELEEASEAAEEAEEEQEEAEEEEEEEAADPDQLDRPEVEWEDAPEAPAEDSFEASEDALEAPKEAQAPAGRVAPAAPGELRYSSMFYKASGTWAFRQKFGDKKQIFQLTKRSLTASAHAELKDQVLLKLNSGQDPQQVEQWARANYL